MKKLKLSHLKSDQAILTREQLKQILGGQNEGSGSNCITYGHNCSTKDGLNCCSGLVCADYLCWYGALTSND